MADEPPMNDAPLPPRPMRSWSRVESFRHALSGWWFVIRTQKNAWIHAVISVAVIVMSIWLLRDLVHWALIILAIAIVWIAEFFNTAMEVVVDLASPDIHPLAKIGKDVAAAAVLVAAAAATVVGLLILGPLLWTRLFGI
jgi:diacylglycerol kinase